MQTSTSGGSRLTEHRALTVSPIGRPPGVARGDDRDPGRELAQRLAEAPVRRSAWMPDSSSAQGAGVLPRGCPGRGPSGRRPAPVAGRGAPKTKPCMSAKATSCVPQPVTVKAPSSPAQPRAAPRRAARPRGSGRACGSGCRGRTTVAERKASSALLRSSSTVIDLRVAREHVDGQDRRRAARRCGRRTRRAPCFPRPSPRPDSRPRRETGRLRRNKQRVGDERQQRQPQHAAEVEAAAVERSRAP